MYFLDAGKLLRATSNPREIPENSLCDEPVKIPQPFNGRRIEIQKVKYPTVTSKVKLYLEKYQNHEGGI